MAGWTIQERQSGGHDVLYLDGETGEETVVGEFEPEVSVGEVIEEVLQRAEVGDWVIGPRDYGVMVVGPADEKPPGS